MASEVFIFHLKYKAQGTWSVLISSTLEEHEFWTSIDRHRPWHMVHSLQNTETAFIGPNAALTSFLLEFNESS